MNKKTLLVGEPMGLFIAQNYGSLEEVNSYLFTVCGAEFNVAIGMKRLNHNVGYMTKLGKDPFGKRILRAMEENGISTELIFLVDEINTGFMLKSMVDTGDPEIYYYRKNSAASTLSAENIKGLDFSMYDAIHMTGITPAISISAREATDMLLEKAKQNEMFFSFDPNLRLQLWKDRNEMINYINTMASKCDIFLPGIKEAEILTNINIPEKIADLYLKMGTKTVIIKLGDKGAYYATANESGYVDGFHVNRIVDTVGAGDGFTAGILTALKEGLSLNDAVLRANAIGAIQVMSRGDNDGLPTLKELNDFMQGNPNWREKNV